MIYGRLKFYKSSKFTVFALFSFCLLLSLNSAFAVPANGSFPFGSISLAEFYNSYSGIIDAIFWTLFFASLSKKILIERIGMKTAVIFGLGMGISLELLFVANDITLANFGPAVALLLVVTFAYLFYEVLKKLEARKSSYCITFLIVVPLILVLTDGVATATGFEDWYRFIATIFLILWIICFIKIIMLIFTTFFSQVAYENKDDVGNSDKKNDENNIGPRDNHGDKETDEEKEKSDPNIKNDLDDLKKQVDNHKNLVDNYGSQTKDLLQKMKDVFENDSTYADVGDIDFDIVNYKRLIDEINKVENNVISKIDVLSKKKLNRNDALRFEQDANTFVNNLSLRKQIYDSVSQKTKGMFGL